MRYGSKVILQLSAHDTRFPESVARLVNPPKQLDVLCTASLGQDFAWPPKRLAVIGSRNMSAYGKRVVWDFVPRLVAAGVAIVSGLAEGVDEEAQRVALSADGVTIGVLGFGVMQLSTFSNQELGKQIVKSGKGFLVSPFEPYARASKWTFLERNRVIAGLAEVLLVVEATQKSGCLSTVEAALELGKEVYVVPGSIFDYTSMGANDLIKQGAQLVNGVDDLIALFA
ncbi:DNA-protecting protein DprA [Patescibacteria group bacterium]|nr:DNA-protecting protein DprA [Patescibacteria group bacterium]MBU1970607.1 DNA-protecting protein DprA [Patescibacteria group bacterium]